MHSSRIERGRQLVPRPLPKFLSVDEEGEPDLNSIDLAHLVAHETWEATRVCAQHGFRGVHHYVGGIDTIESVRTAGPRQPDAAVRYPALLVKILFAGTRSGMRKPAQVRALRRELKAIFPLRGLYEYGERVCPDVIPKLRGLV